jgi:sarcosine oxidase
MEHPGLAAIALRSLALWTELGERAGEVLVSQTGCLSTGAPGSRPVAGAIAAAAAAGVPVVEWGHEELVARQPQYAGLGPEDVAVWDPGAGICYPERNVRAQVAAARRLGAEVWANTEVSAIEVDGDGVTVRTSAGELRARQVVVAAGGWLGELVPGLPLKPRPMPLTWFTPKVPGDFALERFPAFIWQRPGGEVLWGHGSGEGYGVKIGVAPSDHHDIDYLAERVADALPGLEPRPTTITPCLITDSPDEQFLLGRLNPHVVIAGGDSGHGFKHAAGVGELLAQLVTGEPTYCATDFLDPKRFA